MPPKRAPKPKRSASRKQVDLEPDIRSKSGNPAPLTTTTITTKPPPKALPKSILKKASSSKEKEPEKEPEKPENPREIASDSEVTPL